MTQATDSQKPRIGDAVLRKEDVRLLTGQGAFSDDVAIPGQAYAVIVRSPHAHARIISIATEAAKAAPGVLAVLTGTDALADGIKPIPHNRDTPYSTGNAITVRQANFHVKGVPQPTGAVTVVPGKGDAVAIRCP